MIPANRYRLETDDAFWAALAGTGELDEGVVAEYREFYARHDWAPVGTLLVGAGHLSLQDLLGLLERQAEQPGVPLGELALEQGLCTASEVADALTRQARSCPAPLELMRRDPRIGEQALLRALERFVADVSEHD